MSWRYNKPHNRINKMFDELLKLNRKDELTFERIKNGLLNVLDDLYYVRDLKAMEENDWRSGYDTYGYKSLDDIKCNLIYISDRWSCQFRVQWLIDMVYLEGEIE